MSYVISGSSESPERETGQKRLWGRVKKIIFIVLIKNLETSNTYNRYAGEHRLIVPISEPMQFPVRLLLLTFVAGFSPLSELSVGVQVAWFLVVKVLSG